MKGRLRRHKRPKSREFGAVGPNSLPRRVLQIGIEKSPIHSAN
jgi:hypothetical protein